MFHRLGIAGYSNTSTSCRLLRQQLNLKKFKNTDTYGKLINWGNSTLRVNYQGLLNNPESVRKCVSKTKTYELLKAAGIDTIEWTLDKTAAARYGFPLLFRRDGLSQGRGISIINNQAELNQIRSQQGFFAKFYPSRAEYRVHIFRSELVGWQKKQKNDGEEGVTPIRSHDNGFRFSLRNNAGIDSSLLTKCCRCIEVLGLDFGAIDVLLDSRRVYRILEVNTAPGLDEGTILGAYAQKFDQYRSA